MNEDIKYRWLVALRSGEYKQGQMVLHNMANDSYCCLGVLCELYCKEHPDLSVKSQCGHEFEYYFDAHEVLPPEIIEWAGFDEFVSNPSLKLECDNKISIAELNDNGKTFDEIANLIEAQL